MAHAAVINLAEYRQKRLPAPCLPDPDAFVTRAQLVDSMDIGINATFRALSEYRALGLPKDQREALKIEILRDLVPDLSAAVADELNIALATLKSQMKRELVEDLLPAVAKMIRAAMDGHTPQFTATLDMLDREIESLLESEEGAATA